MKFYSFWRSLATHRVRIALYLKGLSPEIIDVNLMKGHQRDPQFREVNPAMAIPALVDGEGPALFESLAIIEYLDEVHPRPPLLPTEPRARARVRGLAQIVASDSHPLIVPRIREYLEHELKLDEPTRTKWCAHWTETGLKALEQHLARDGGSGRFCHGDVVTLADICLASQAVQARYYNVELASYPTVSRIVAECNQLEAFQRAHPLKQPGAPAA